MALVHLFAADDIDDPGDLPEQTNKVLEPSTGSQVYSDLGLGQPKASDVIKGHARTHGDVWLRPTGMQ